MIELFYDLVFAYMISQATSLIHHLSHGTVSPISFLIFAVVVIVFINSWMVQSVFTNRFGSSSWTDIAFYFVDMMILLYMTNSFGNTSSENMTTFFKYFIDIFTINNAKIRIGDKNDARSIENTTVWC